MSEMTCLTCGKNFDSEQSTALPFCSLRCKAVDLNGWFQERHGIPVDRESEEEPDWEDV